MATKPFFLYHCCVVLATAPIHVHLPRIFLLVNLEAAAFGWYLPYLPRLTGTRKKIVYGKMDRRSWCSAETIDVQLICAKLSFPGPRSRVIQMCVIQNFLFTCMFVLQVKMSKVFLFTIGRLWDWGYRNRTPRDKGTYNGVLVMFVSLCLPDPSIKCSWKTSSAVWCVLNALFVKVSQFLSETFSYLDHCC